MEPDDNSFSDLYSVADSDYALNALEKVFGGIVPYVSGQDDAYNNIGTFLTPFIGTMNIIMLCLAVLVGAYTFLSLVADTAADGEVLGRSADTKNTFLRAGAAALLFLPVSGGFSVVQLLTFGVAVGGSGIANEAWNRYSRETLDGTAYTAPATNLSNGDWAMRGQLADATYTMVLGRLCELHMDRLAGIYNVNAQTTRMGVPTTSTEDASSGLFWDTNASETKSYEWFYQTGDGADASNDICGSIQYSITYNTPPHDEDQPGSVTSLYSFADNLKTLAQNQVYNSVVNTLNSIVQPRAAALADRIYSGEAGSTTGSLRNDAVVQAEIKSIANEAALAIYNSRSGLAGDTAAMQQIQEDMIASVTANGWVMAPVWQRMMAQLYVSVRELQTNLDMRIDRNERIGKIFGTSTFGWWGSDNEVSRASFAPVERDMDYLRSHLQFVLFKMKQADAESSNTNPLGEDAGAEMGGQSLRGFYNFFINRMGPSATGGSAFKDPFMEYTDVGANLFWIATPLVGGSSIAEGVAGVVGADKLVGVITGPVKALGYFILAMAFAYMLLIPTIPMLYFLSGVVSWAMLVIEAVFALPLALLMWLVPAREPSMIGPWNKVMVTLTGLLLRPFLMIAGLIACILMLWIGNELLAVFFRNMLMAMTPNWTISAIIMICGLVGLYCYATVLLALHCSSLINLFGDAVMGWIGGIASPLNRETMGENLAGTARAAAPVPGLHGARAGLESVGGGAVQARNKLIERQQKRNQARLGSGN